MVMATTFKGLFTFACVSCLLLWGSRAYGTSFSLSPSGEINFSAKTGATATQVLAITNTTTAPIYITLSKSGAGASFFTTSSNTFVIAPYGTDSVTLSFMPTVAGTDSATLTVASSAGDSATATLLGRATSAAFEITPEGTLVLNAQAGSTGTDTLKLHNQTNSSVSATLGLSGSNASLFTLSSTSVNVPGDSTASVRLNFLPTLAGTDSAMLTIISSTGDTERLSVVGHAKPLMPFTLSPSGSLVFNTSAGVADTQMLTITNRTATALPLTISQTGSSYFSIKSTSVTVAANGTTTVPVVFESNTSGTFTGMLMVHSLTGDTSSISLTGHVGPLNGKEKLNVTNEVDFKTQVGDTECLNIMVPNPTTGVLTISNISLSGNNAFSTSGTNSMTIAAGSTGMIDVCMHPTVKGDIDGMLTFNYSSAVDSLLNGTVNVNLDGQAQAATSGPPVPFFLVSGPLEFNNIIVGQEDCQALQITNPTGQAVTIDSAHLSGSEAGEYTVTGATMLQVAGNSTEYVNVCLTPVKAGGDQDATLSLYYTVNGTNTTGKINVQLNANAIDTMSNPGELSNCIYVRHEQGVIGPIILGGMDTSAIYLTNRTNNAVTINSASIGGSGSSVFTVTNTFPMTIQSGAEGQLMVAFNPTVTGSPSFGADITLNATGSGLTCGPITIHVEGVAVPGKMGSRDTSDIDLGSQLTGNGTSVITITNPNFSVQSCVNDTIAVTNTTASTITINNMLIPSNANITLVGNVTPVTLAPGQSVNAVVQFCGNGTVNQVFDAPLYIATDQSIQPQVYSIQAIDAAAASSVAENAPVSIDFSIQPNPSAGDVTINVSGAGKVKAEIYNLLGSLVTTLDGTSNISWNGSDASGSQVSSGAYIVRVSGTDVNGQPFVASKEMVIQR